MTESAARGVKKSLGLLWFAVIGVIISIGVAGTILGHSDSFKQQCGERKVGGTSLGWFKNTVCDMDFELSS